MKERKNVLNKKVIIKKITQNLKIDPPDEFESPYLKKSAILILLVEKDSQLKIIMTSRSSKLNNHTGEMSFPGGKFDVYLDYDLKHTAIRETVEEIGIEKNKISILGRLNDLPTITGYLIRPFIGILDWNDSDNFAINHQEVAHLVEIPLNYLLRKNLFTETPMKIFEGTTIPLLSFDFKDPNINKIFHIWGASAHILAEFLKKIFEIDNISNKYKRPNISEINDYFKKKLKGKNLPH
ncbi:putative Nudix hydrolase NudL [Candidatus Lokiarchaeum ossiferum]|uniref:Nudix hydrolase NudL n=1 Tax=Candidatus Lokiarchaeum ossiferum TaxID=2951803 RepID=A0ABY6HSH5_9ARCH|nr:putative Nudix hydrolase NudL [Candidatus Lokiarchaeum sp. B-35]